MNELEQISETVKGCTLCRLHSFRNQAVPGEGSPQAEIMFIGEGPGKKEDELGRPFVGAAGKFLDELLATINLSRQDVFIANTVKCRPPDNRDPEPDEKATCRPYLEQQLRLIQPKLICLLGKHALDSFIPGMKISQNHGNPKVYKGVDGKKQAYLPLYHPAAALYNGSLRTTLVADFKKIPIILEKLTDMGY